MRMLLCLFVAIWVSAANAHGQMLPMIANSPEDQATVTIPDDLSVDEAFDFFVGLSDADARQLLLQEWRERQDAQAAMAGAPSGLAVLMVRFRLWLERNLVEIGNKAGVTIMAAPQAPEFARKTLARAVPSASPTLIMAVAAVAVGAVLGWLIHRSCRGLTANFSRPSSTLTGGLLSFLIRLAAGLLPVVAFALAAIGGISLAFSEQPEAKGLASGILTAISLILASHLGLRLLFASNRPDIRLIQVSDKVARDLETSLLGLVITGAMFWTIAAYLILAGRPPAGIHLTYVLISGFAVFVAASVIILQFREPAAAAIRAGRANPFLPDRLRAALADRLHVLLLIYLAITALLWTAAMLTDRPSVLWPAVGSLGLLSCLPLMDRTMRRGIAWSVNKLSLASLPEVPTHGSDEGGGPVTKAPQIDPEAYIELLSRAGRILLVIFVGFVIVELWGGDVLMTIGAPGASSLWRVSGEIFIILVVAYIAWQVMETALTRGFVRRHDQDDQERLRMAARARTLLPLIRTFLLVTLVIIVIMIMLSSLGVDIGPLIAGAGVAGIAIGFGAQSLVRDIVSGVFFLLDDAFRVGEYIEMETIRGEVEAITLRSLRLRHHRGHIFTVPFSELRYIINYNRDWVIYKMPIRVPADTSPALVKRIVKQIGKDLMADPELGPKFIEPLKSQGVYAIDDDSALIIRVKFMCKPREQFLIRREAYHLIRTRFAEHGIEFARRKVEVSGPGGKPVSEQVAAGVGDSLDQPKTGSDPLAQ